MVFSAWSHEKLKNTTFPHASRVQGLDFKNDQKKKVGVFDAFLVCFHVDVSVKFAYQTNVKTAKKA